MPKKSNDEVAKELSLGVGMLLGILLIFPLIIFAIPFFIAARILKQPKIHLVVSVLAGVVLVFCLMYRSFDYFGIYQYLPFGVSFLEDVFNQTIIFTNVSWVIYFSGGIVTSYIWDVITTYIRSKKVHSIEQEQDEFKTSNEFQRVYQKRHDLNKKAQKRWRKQVMDGKTDKLLLGINQRGKPFHMDFKEVNQHMFVPATTGGGKTVLLLNYIEYALMKNYPVVFIDGKGSAESIDDVRKISEKYGKEIRVFSDVDSLTYNPIRHGNATVITDKLQALVETESQYYVKVNEVLVQTLIQFIDAYDFTRDLWTFEKYLNPKKIKEVLNGDLMEVEESYEETEEKKQKPNYSSFLDEEPEEETESETIIVTKKRKKKVRSDRADRFYKRFFEDWEATDEGELYLFENASVVRLAITALLEKELGQLFREKENGLDLLEVSANKDVLFISFDGSIYDKYIKTIARFIIYDLNFLVSYRNRQKMKEEPILAVYDEFSVYANDKIVDTVNKSRSAGFHCIIATQTIADLRKVDQHLPDQVIGNTNTYAIGQTNNDDEHETWANKIGTYKDPDITTVTERQEGRLKRVDRKADQGTVRLVQKYKITPDEIRNLRTGEFVIFRKAAKDKIDPEVVYVRHPLMD
ncbi:TraM recognition domain-containing protein [Halobacillus ihumii]|uniref:TraM recognition domain-containing protein n=1 Tax=Halobacillus ihumii TaxID=2686092 RepID=UPI0013D819CB|nr:TraM recognition domain-containing protein [Halobacillus ihumii]